jgi:hypothetical protein
MACLPVGSSLHCSPTHEARSVRGPAQRAERGVGIRGPTAGLSGRWHLQPGGRLLRLGGHSAAAADRGRGHGLGRAGADAGEPASRAARAPDRLADHDRRRADRGATGVGAACCTAVGRRPVPGLLRATGQSGRRPGAYPAAGDALGGGWHPAGRAAPGARSLCSRGGGQPRAGGAEPGELGAAVAALGRDRRSVGVAGALCAADGRAEPRTAQARSGPSPSAADRVLAPVADAAGGQCLFQGGPARGLRTPRTT